MANTAAKKLVAFRKQLAQMPLEYLFCHCFGHQVTPSTINPDGKIFVIGLLCGSCGMEIERFRDSYTGKVQSRYWHPKGDYYFRGTGAITPLMKLEIEEAWRSSVDLPKAD